MAKIVDFFKCFCDAILRALVFDEDDKIQHFTREYF